MIDHLLQIRVLQIRVLQIRGLQIRVLQIRVLQIRVLQILVLQIRVLQIRVLQIRVLQIRVLQIRVLQIHVLQIQSEFYKSNPVRVLQYAFGNDMWTLIVERRGKCFNRVLPRKFQRYWIKVQNDWSSSFTHMADVLSRLRCSTTTDKKKREEMSIVFFYIYLQYYCT